MGGYSLGEFSCPVLLGRQPALRPLLMGDRWKLPFLSLLHVQNPGYWAWERQGLAGCFREGLEGVLSDGVFSTASLLPALTLVYHCMCNEQQVLLIGNRCSHVDWAVSKHLPVSAFAC